MNDTTTSTSPATLREGDPALALHQSLEYLYREAMAMDLRLVAHLIGAASEAAREIATGARGRVIPFPSGRE